MKRGESAVIILISVPGNGSLGSRREALPLIQTIDPLFPEPSDNFRDFRAGAGTVLNTIPERSAPAWGTLSSALFGPAV